MPCHQGSPPRWRPSQRPHSSQTTPQEPSKVTRLRREVQMEYKDTPQTLGTQFTHAT